MDKLSIYEFFSFLLPGVIAIEVSKVFFSKIDDYVIFEAKDIFSGILVLSLALCIGSILHVLCFMYLQNIKCFKNIIHIPMDNMKNDEYITEIYPKLREIYAQRNGYSNTENISKSEVFDTAYYFLEAENKIAQAKSFQSLYFLFRNIFVLGCFFILLIVGKYIFELIQGECDVFLIYHIIILVVMSFVCMVLARWYRVKMTDRVLGLYYAILTHKK